MPPLQGPATATTTSPHPPAPKRPSYHWKKKKRSLLARSKTQLAGEGINVIPATIDHIQTSYIECDICCSTNIAADNVTMCSSGHVFCKDCARKMAESQIGLRRSALPCMAMEGCAGSFEEAEAREFLAPATFRLWERIKAEEEIKSAGLGDIEHCPFCDFAAMIDNKNEKLFRCFNGECSRLSCRSCKRKDHIPKSCLEHDIELRERSVHDAEEQLSAVLMRRCPQVNCNTPIIKEETVKSCNRMTCAVCKKDMCYCCRKDVSVEGYRHFDMESDARKPTDKCPLWEDSMERHKKDIEGAKAKIGAAASKKTEAEQQDEMQRRRMFREQQGVDLFGMDGAIHFEDEEEPLYVLPEREERQWIVHTAVLAERRRRQEQIREAKNQQQELDLANRFEALTQREDRLQVLGFGTIAPFYPRVDVLPAIRIGFDDVKAPVALLPVDKQPHSQPQINIQPKSQQQRRSSLPAANKTEKSPSRTSSPRSPQNSKTSPPRSPQISKVDSSSLVQKASPSRTRKKRIGPLVQATRHSEP